MQQRTLSYLILIVSFMVFISDTLQKPDYTPDDTYIYMKYAKNISSGSGFAFNPGESSYGVTSPLWVLLLTMPYFIGLDGYWFSKILDLFAALASIAVFFRLSKFFFASYDLLRYAATAMFILNAWFIRWAFTGMETSFAVFLVLYLFYLYYSHKYSLMFFTAGLMYLTRPESVVLIALLFFLIVFRQVKEKRIRITEHLKYIGLFLITVLPFFIFAKLSFGTILPNTALGKSTLSLNAGVIVNQLTEISKTLAGAGMVEMILSLLFIVLAFKKREFQNTIPLFLWIFGLIILYIITDADIISRYLLLISPFFVIIGLKSMEKLNIKGPIVITVVFLISVFYSQIIFYKFVKPSTDDFTKGVNECFLPIADWINLNTPVSSKILVNDVGAIGYYSNRYIIDAAALVNRDLKLNKEIMNTPLDDRLATYKLLRFIETDYVIERESSEQEVITSFGKYQFKLELTKKFPSLGISDRSPRYYKIYKVTKGD